MKITNTKNDNEFFQEVSQIEDFIREAIAEKIEKTEGADFVFGFPSIEVKAEPSEFVTATVKLALGLFVS